MSMGYQWFSPAPMMTIDLPGVLSALSANWRATLTTSAHFTPVMRSCQAGVYGRGSSSPSGHSPGSPSRPTP